MISPRHTSSLAHSAIIQECAEDYTGLWSILLIVESNYKDEAMRYMNVTGMPSADRFFRSKTIEVLFDLMVQGEIVPGIPTEDGDFIRWNMTPMEAINRIFAQWPVSWKPRLGDIVWFTSSEQ